MDWGTALSDVNLLAAAVAVVASFVVGFIWYSPNVFGEMWRKGAGLTKKQMESPEGMAGMMVATAVVNLISTLFLGAVLLAIGTDSAGEGALNGAIIGFALVALRMSTHHIFARKNVEHMLIEGGNEIVVFAIQGAILGGIM